MAVSLSFGPAVSPPGKTTWRVSLCAETGRYLQFSKRNLFEMASSSRILLKRDLPDPALSGAHYCEGDCTPFDGVVEVAVHSLVTISKL
jgi:hypothetical protein